MRKENESHPIRNGIIATVVGGALLSLWPSFRAAITKLLFWLLELAKGCWGYFSTKHESYGWMIVALIALSIPTIIRFLAKLQQTEEPSYQDLYTEDQLFGVKWQWIYIGNSISHLSFLCPHCENELVYSEFVPDRYDFTHDGKSPKTTFHCERCGTVKASMQGRLDYTLGTVEREIRRKIRTNQWQKSQTNS